MTQGRYIITVNGFRVKQCKEGKDTACIRIEDKEDSSGMKYAKFISINGPSKILQNNFDPENPNTPFIYIETDSDIEWE